MDYFLEVKIPGLPRTTNGSHGHWRAKAERVKVWKRKVFTACWHLRPPNPLDQAHITFTRFSSVEPDFDNLVISFKPIMDGLKQAGVITDDKRGVVGRPRYEWVKSSPKNGFISIRVESTTKEKQDE